jgi:hypothetical protein
MPSNLRIDRQNKKKPSNKNKTILTSGASEIETFKILRMILSTTTTIGP